MAKTALERRMKIQLEEQKAVNRYLLNLKRIRIANTTSKIHHHRRGTNHAIETDMWLKESQQPRINLAPSTMQKCIPRPTQQSRPNANVIPRATNSNMPLSDRSKMTCHKSTIYTNYKRIRKTAMIVSKFGGIYSI